MFLVVGQGNPGERYARTRHNLGFMVLDRLGLSFRPRGEALVAEAEGGLFLKPLTYYNLTGRAVAPLARFYKIPPERILVVHDGRVAEDGTPAQLIGGGGRFAQLHGAWKVSLV